ncbi:helix-turn-helix domain-containing protein [Polaromonas sp. JS666]|uniref:helix-turn-helix domain-containing protein n=1 Tax=Polaromonas sp. (strain JS666 / ATCC BAA-500) TaxID=296591 RepID=UPI0000464808|nr:helix-turn-helix transcriptional regulator [Polaromonas sp. JS666]ABE44566.1 transcriptional regulator, XRE family [Polaromonas sp. JS666]
MKTLFEVATRLEAERQRLKLDYQAIAEKTGLTSLSVRSALQGRTAPRITTLMAIADQLGLEVLLLPKVLAAGLEAPAGAGTGEGPEPALSQVDRIIAQTRLRSQAGAKGPLPK